MIDYLKYINTEIVLAWAADIQIVLSIIMIVAAWIIGKRQLRYMHRQNDISTKQAEISENQFDISERQRQLEKNQILIREIYMPISDNINDFYIEINANPDLEIVNKLWINIRTINLKIIYASKIEVDEKYISIVVKYTSTGSDILTLMSEKIINKIDNSAQIAIKIKMLNDQYNEYLLNLKDV